MALQVSGWIAYRSWFYRYLGMYYVEQFPYRLELNHANLNRIGSWNSLRSAQCAGGRKHKSSQQQAITERAAYNGNNMVPWQQLINMLSNRLCGQLRICADLLGKAAPMQS